MQKRNSNYENPLTSQNPYLKEINHQSENKIVQNYQKDGNTNAAQKIVRKESIKRQKSKILSKIENYTINHSNEKFQPSIGLVKQKSRRSITNNNKNSTESIPECLKIDNLNKNDKKKRIKDILRNKLGIVNINELVLGKMRKFDEDQDVQQLKMKDKNGMKDEEQNQKIIFSDIYKFKGILGIGMFGVVILVINIKDQCQRALKIIYKTRLNDEETEVIKTESEILQKLRQKQNIVQFYKMFEGKSYIFIEMDYIAGGQLKRIYEKRLQHEKNQDYYKFQLQDLKVKDETQHADEFYESKIDLQKSLFSDEEASIIVKGILQGLVGIHELDVIHRDIKPENIMLEKIENQTSIDIKIVDFGLSAKYKGNQKQQIDDKIGTLLFMAPEQISMQNYGKKIDMFACGIVLYYLFCGKHPIYVYGDTQIIYKKKLMTIEPEKWHYPSYISNLAKDFISRICRISQIQRYDAKRALQHPWITRNSNDKIPLTRTEEMQQFDTHQTLSKLIRAVTFLSIVKNNINPPVVIANELDKFSEQIKIINDLNPQFTESYANETHQPFSSKGMTFSYLDKIKQDCASNSDFTEFNSFTLSSFLGNQDKTAITESSKRILSQDQSMNIDSSQSKKRTFLPQISNKFTQRDDQRDFSIKKNSAKKEVISLIFREREKLESQNQQNGVKVGSKMGSPSPTLRLESHIDTQFNTNNKKQLNSITKYGKQKPINPKSIEQTPQRLKFQNQDSTKKSLTMKKQNYYSDFNATSNFQSEFVRNVIEECTFKQTVNLNQSKNIKRRVTEQQIFRQSMDFQQFNDAQNTQIVSNNMFVKNQDVKKLLGKTLTMTSVQSKAQASALEAQIQNTGRKILFQNKQDLNSDSHYSMPPIQKQLKQPLNNLQQKTPQLPITVNLNHLKTKNYPSTKVSRNHMASLTVDNSSGSNHYQNQFQKQKQINHRYSQFVPQNMLPQQNIPNKQSSPNQEFMPYQNSNNQNLQSGLKHSLSVCKSNELSQYLLTQLNQNSQKNQYQNQVQIQPKKRLTQVDSTQVKLLQQQVFMNIKEGTKQQNQTGSSQNQMQFASNQKRKSHNVSFNNYTDNPTPQNTQ